MTLYGIRSLENKDEVSPKNILSVKCSKNTAVFCANYVQIIRAMRDVTAFAELPLRMQNKLAAVGRYER